jgi:hypothetical protein
MRPDTAFALFMFIALPWILGWIVRTVLSHQRYMRVLQLKAEANAKLMDRFGQDPSLLEFLKGDGQRDLFEIKMAGPVERMPAPYSRMLTSVQLSVLLLAAGWACLFVKGYMPGRDQLGFLFFGTMGIALGVGALLSAVAAYAAARIWQAAKNDE